MKVVATALGDGLNVTATGAAERSVIERSLHLEFLDGLRRWNRKPQRVVAGNVIRVHTVNLVTVLSSARAVHRDALRVAPHGSVIGKLDGCTRRQSQNLC